jgi:hypothetical protein
MLDGTTGDLVEERRAVSRRGCGRTSSHRQVSAVGKAGRRFVAENFDMRTQVAGLEAIYSVRARRRRAAGLSQDSQRFRAKVDVARPARIHCPRWTSPS